MAEPVLKCIDTQYKGYFFRSRLEARWAVFFDALNIRWIYEPEGYHHNNFLYLPDFFIPHIDSFYEVKPDISSINEDAKKLIDIKADMLVKLTKKNVYVSFGNIPFPINDDFEGHYIDAYWSVPGDYPAKDFPYLWCDCDKCGLVKIQYDGRAGRNCKCYPGDRHYRASSIRMLNAYKKARSERFRQEIF